MVAKGRKLADFYADGSLCREWSARTIDQRGAGWQVIGAGAFHNRSQAGAFRQQKDGSPTGDIRNDGNTVV